MALVVGLLLSRGGEVLALSASALTIMLVLVILSFVLPRIVAAPAVPLGRAALHVAGIRNLSLALVVAALLGLPALTTLSILAYGLVMHLGAGALWARLKNTGRRRA